MKVPKFIAGLAQYGRYGQSRLMSPLAQHGKFQGKNMALSLISAVFLKTCISFPITKSYVSYSYSQRVIFRPDIRDHFRDVQGQNSFHNDTKMLFTCSPMLPFALMIEKQLWVQSPVPYCKSRQWLGTIQHSLPYLHSSKQNKESQFHLRMSLMKLQKVFISLNLSP